MSTRYVAVTMSRDNYKALLHGKDGKHGFKNKEKVLEYLNLTLGLLGEVVDIKVED